MENTQINISVVEDQPEVRDSLCDLLRLSKRFAGLNAYASAEDLFSDPALDQTSLCILDIGLPGMNGWEVLERLKLEDHAGDFPIIVLTAAGDPVNRLIGKLQERVKRYIVKPYSIEELSTAVREVLEIG